MWNEECKNLAFREKNNSLDKHQSRIKYTITAKFYEDQSRKLQRSEERP